MAIIEGAGASGYTVAGAPGTGTAAVQTLTIGGTPTGGTFRLAHQGFVTADITWTAVDATLVSRIDAALEALPSIGTGGVVTADSTLTSGIGDATLTFGKAPVSLVTVNKNALTGTLPTLAIAETTPGVAETAVGAPKGALLTDTTNGKLYINTGTAADPTWTLVGSQT
jgi:hypothetical protein